MLQRLAKGVAYLGLIVGAVALVALLALETGVQLKFGAQFKAQPDPIVVRSTPALVAEGERLADISGCTGCHGGDLAGKLFGDDEYGVVYASNLTRAVPAYSDQQIAQLVRQGVRPDGTSVWGMPSSAFRHISDADLAAIIAYLRTRPPVGKVHPRYRPSLKGKIEQVTGGWPAESITVRKTGAAAPLDAGPKYANGRYLAELACSECHGPKLDGEKGGKPPDLMIAASYDLASFRKLMRTGVGAGGRDLGLMSKVARRRFVRFTDAEIDQVHAYLVRRAELKP